MSDNDANVAVEDATPLLQLFTEVDPEGHAAAYLPVRWCLSQAMIDEIQRREFKKPYLMITLRSVSRSTQYDAEIIDRLDTAHYVVPLDQELTYVSFRRAGTHELLATVIDMQDSDVVKKVVRWTNHPGRDSYEDSMFEVDGAAKEESFTYWHGYTPVPYIDTHFMQRVEVDSKMFAHERAGWTKWLVNTFFENKSKDECHFRRRLLLSFLFTALSLTIGLGIRIIALLVVLALGIRQLNWKTLNPFAWNDDGFPVQEYEDKTSIWVHDKNGNSRGWPFWLVNPVTLTLLPLITWGITHIREHHGNGAATYRLANWGWWQTVLYIDGGLVVLVLAIFVGGILIIQLIGGISSLFSSQVEESAQVDESEAKEIAAYYSRLQAMTCTTGAANPSVGALPKDKQTVTLRFAELKGKVCKPFAQ